MKSTVQDRVEAFFTGSLNPEERRALLDDLAHDQELRQEFDFQEALILAVHEEELRKENAATSSRTSSFLPIRRFWPYMAAASVILILGLIWLVDQRGQTPSWADFQGQIASADGYFDGGLKYDGAGESDSLALWIRQGEYAKIAGIGDAMSSRSFDDSALSQSRADSLYALSISMMYGAEKIRNLAGADSLLAVVRAHSTNEYLREWALRQQIEVALLGKDKQKTRGYVEAYLQENPATAMKNRLESLLSALDHFP